MLPEGRKVQCDRPHGLLDGARHVHPGALVGGSEAANSPAQTKAAGNHLSQLLELPSCGLGSGSVASGLGVVDLGPELLDPMAVCGSGPAVEHGSGAAW